MTRAANPAPTQSQWQEKITGEWHGCPSVFDAEGRHLGFNHVARSSVFAGGRTTYFMQTDLEVTGPLQSRFAASKFAFGVQDNGTDRVYMGPDFFGSGNPAGSVVDANYYSPAWSSNLRTLVHVLADGQTQVYSSQLFEGPRLISVFNGMYLQAVDYADNAATKAKVDAFIASEKRRGNAPHILPMKTAGEWRGEFQVYDAEHQPIGASQVKIDYRPLDLRRATFAVSMEGAVNFRANYTRSREGSRHDFEGPDMFGNAFAYGRALYSHCHVRGSAVSIVGRDFLIDDQWGMSCVWQFSQGGKPVQMLYGVLSWHEGAEVLTAQY